METENLMNHELARMAAFRILSDCFFLPDPGLSEKLGELEFNLAKVCSSSQGFTQGMRKEFKASADLEPLKVDFAKLFVGPYKLSAAPYGSVYLDGERKMMGNSTLDARERYRDAGLNTAKTFKDAPDHISAELEFMHYLIYKEIEAFANSDKEMAIVFIQKQNSFLEDHLMAWVPQFANDIIKNAETTFYRHLAKTTTMFLKKNNQIVYSLLDTGQQKSERNRSYHPRRN